MNIDISDYEHKYYYMDSKALRLTIYDGDFNISFDQLEDLIKYLNENPHDITNKINFDDLVKKYQPK